MDFSNFNYSMSTPRSSAMGGAFGSLGADLASMSINPAGLGMYRGSEFGTTMSVMTNNMIPEATGGLEYKGNNLKTRFLLNNIGMVLNMSQSNGPVTSTQFGFGYNRLADLNYNMAFATPRDTHTVGELFAQQVTGIPSTLFEDNRNPFSNPNIDPSIWGGVLAWKTFLIDNYNGIPDQYTISSLAPDATKTHYSEFTSRGYVGEFTISGAMNLNNKLYLGATMSILSISNDRYLYYEEAYPDFDPAFPDDLRLMQYQQRVSFTGGGVALKLGAIYRPIKSLRIGLAFHTPYLVGLERSYDADMATNTHSNLNSFVSTAILHDSYSYSTPPRLMAGVSYTFGKVGLVSVDYEKVWWNGMRSQDNTRFNDMVRDYVTVNLKGQDNVRIGAEFKPTAAIALRAGATYTGSKLRSKAVLFDNPVAYRSGSVSLGAGFRLYGGYSLDLTYVYAKTDYTSYPMYSMAGVASTPDVKPYGNRSLYMLGFSSRF